MTTPFHVRFTRFSAFYSPLISTVTGGFLAAEGFAPTITVSTPADTTVQALVDGRAHVGQTAPIQGILAIDRGGRSPIVHFAQVNEKDGFFLLGRRADPKFNWKKLEGAKVIIDFDTQPLAMFKWVCFKQGVDYEKIIGVKVHVDDMIDAYRRGEGDYVHLQGPAPQQLAREGLGSVVATFGDAVDPCAFSSVAATPAFYESEMAKAFGRAYRKARNYINDKTAIEIAKAEKQYFPDVDLEALTEAIAHYQRIGCWTRHPEITKPMYEQSLDIFAHVGLINSRPAYEDVIAPTP
jgi:NitT/TauT family transport system substrate-binding protein